MCYWVPFYNLQRLSGCMVFNAVLNIKMYRGGLCTFPCIPGVLINSTPHNILSKPLPAFPHRLTNVETMDSGEKGMDTV